MHRSIHTRGISIVEVLFGVSIFALITIFTTQSISLFLEAGNRAQEEMQAVYLATEGLEVIRFIRDENWDTLADLAVDTPYYLAMTPTTLATTTVPEVIGVYERSFVLRDVYRNAVDDIVASTTPGAAIDSGSTYVQMNVRWGSETLTLDALLTNIFNI